MNGLHARKGEVYERDVATLRRFRDGYYRITLHKTIRRAGYEAVDGEPSRGRKNTTECESKLEASISRTRSKIFELAICNDWSFFVTLTLNPQYHNRKDLGQYKKNLSNWLKNYNRKYKTQIAYILIPEQHQDGSWHMHGLMSGLPTEHLHEFTEQEKLPINILLEIKRGHTIYNWEAYQENFGYITLSPIRNMENVAKYITKYVTKDIAQTSVGAYQHLYYCTQGLRRAEKLYQGPLTRPLDEDYSNEYVKIKTVRTFEEAIGYFTDEDESGKLTGKEPQ